MEAGLGGSIITSAWLVRLWLILNSLLFLPDRSRRNPSLRITPSLLVPEVRTHFWLSLQSLNCWQQEKQQEYNMKEDSNLCYRPYHLLVRSSNSNSSSLVKGMEAMLKHGRKVGIFVRESLFPRRDKNQRSNSEGEKEGKSQKISPKG